MPGTSTAQRVWIFAYGSLIWRPDFAFDRRVRAQAKGWVRRFWQASADHRGTPGSPGRVVTLQRRPLGLCDGFAYRLEYGDEDDTMTALDQREQGGYRRQRIEIVLEDDTLIEAVTWVAFPDNAFFLGPANSAAIAAQIASACGPSGSNREYFEQLADTLRQLDARDPHVQRIAKWLAAPHT